MKKTQDKKREGRRQGRSGVGASVELELERLDRRFEQFRRSHEPGSRIPDALRAAALDAQDRGASEGDLRRACEATSKQLEQWRAQQRRGATVGAAAEPVARVFDVVDEPAEREAGSGSGSRAPELELRLGGWAVRISQLDG